MPPRHNLRRNSKRINKFRAVQHQYSVFIQSQANHLHSFWFHLKKFYSLKSFYPYFLSQPVPEKIRKDICQKSNNKDEIQRNYSLYSEKHYRYISRGTQEKYCEKHCKIF